MTDRERDVRDWTQSVDESFLQPPVARCQPPVRRRPFTVARVPRASLIPLILTLLPFAIFWRQTLGREVFYLHDVQYYFYPYHKLVVDTIRDGHLPLWNPHAFSGIPLLGDGQTAMFYPPNWIFFVLSPMHALAVVAIAQFSIAGVGMWAYARSLRVSHLAALLAALAFMFNGFLAARVVHLSIMAGAALIPLIFWSIERLLQRPTPGSFALAAAAVALQALAGHPQVPIYTAIAAGVYTLAIVLRWWWRSRQLRELWALVYLGGAYLAGYGLAAIQLAPWIEFARFSPRAAGASYEFVAREALRGPDWLLFVFPYGFGGARESWLQTLPASPLPIYVWERLAYVGILPLGLALVGLADLRREPAMTQAAPDADSRFRQDRCWALVIVAVLCGLIAAGSSTPFGQLVYALPVVGKLRAYARAIAPAAFALVALAAFGVERLRRAGATTRRAALAAAALLLTVGLTPLWEAAAGYLAGDAARGIAAEPGWTTIRVENMRVPMLLAVASATLLVMAARRLTRPLLIVMIGLVAADVIAVAALFNPTMPPDDFGRVPPGVALLQRDREPYRTVSFITNEVLPPRVAQSQLAVSWSIPYRIDAINGFNSLQPRRYTDVLFGPDVEDVSYGFLGDEQLLCPGHRLLSMLNVRYALIQPATGIVPGRGCATPLGEDTPSWTRIYSDRDVIIYRNTMSHPRVYVADEVRVEHDPQTILARVRDPAFDPHRLALVEGALTDARAAALSGGGNAEARLTPLGPNDLLIETRAAAPRLVVLSEMWFPGWAATIDGRRVPIHRVNYLLRGVEVPAGTHTIRMSYRPASALIGAGISGVTLFGLIGTVVVRRRRRG